MENGRLLIAMGEYIDTLGEIYLERERYLLSADELIEEMLDKTKIEITDNIKVEYGRNTGTVCFGALVDIDEGHGAEIKTVEQLPVCSNICRKIVEMATPHS
jgi:hypothetical protein